MKTQSIFNMVQLLTGLAVIFGLILVIWELRQTREIAKAQLSADSFALYVGGIRAVMGENGARAWAKACDEPDSMTTEDMLVMNLALVENLNRMRSTYIQQQVSEDLTSSQWDDWNGNFSNIFSTEFGKWWWKSQQFWEPEIVDEGNRILREGKFGTCTDYFDGYRSRQVADSE